MKINAPSSYLEHKQKENPYRKAQKKPNLAKPSVADTLTISKEAYALFEEMRKDT